MKQRALVRLAVAMKERRAAAKQTQEQAAEHIGISYSYYVKIENAIQSPSVDTLVKICDAYRISLDWLLQEKITAEEFGLTITLSEVDARQIQGCCKILEKLIVNVKEVQKK